MSKSAVCVILKGKVNTGCSFPPRILLRGTLLRCLVVCMFPSKFSGITHQHLQAFFFRISVMKSQVHGFRQMLHDSVPEDIGFLGFPSMSRKLFDEKLISDARK